jgi:putative Holliday junction resolvase
MMRILGVDFGEKRIGLAVSDPLGMTAQGLPTLENKGKKNVLAAFQKLCAEQGVGELVIGLPRNMNGTMGPKANEIQVLVPELEKVLNIPIVMWDERLTSRQAGRLMIEEGMSRSKQRQNSDRLAATLILQSYLEFKRLNQGEKA